MEIVPRYLPRLKDSFFLFGPRGTGKTTWLRMSYPDAVMTDFLSSEVFLTYSAEPDRMIELVDGNPGKRTFIIDEIQRVPALLSVIHKIIEEKTKVQFILTGSSTRKLKKAGVDLLAGRAILKKCHPFMASECGNLFNLPQAMRFGMIPLIMDSDHPAEVLNSYVNLYIREEIQAEGMVRDIGSFARFLEAVSFSHATLLNVSEVARECTVDRKTVEGYIDILEDLLLAYRIPVFAKRAKRILVRHNKFYFCDAGIYAALRPRGPLDSTSEISGPALEGLILQHLKAWCEYSSDEKEIYYWRTKAGREIDFVIYGEHEFAAIEIKSSRLVHRKNISSLLAFKEDYPEASLFLLYQGKEILSKNGVFCIPCEIFLRQLVPDQPLWTGSRNS